MMRTRLILGFLCLLTLITTSISAAPPPDLDLRHFLNHVGFYSLAPSQGGFTNPPIVFYNQGTALGVSFSFNCSTNITCSFVNGQMTIAGTGGGGTGCVPPGTANNLLYDNGAGGCLDLGALGTTTTLYHGNAAGIGTFGSVVSADLNITGTTCTNQFVRNISSSAAGTCNTINLASDVTGQLPIGNVGSAGLSGTSPVTISAAGAIGCSTCNTSSATVSSIATTSPITGGTITTTGTIACATCGVTGSPLSQFAPTTSSQLAGVLSDETGTAGFAVFSISPALTGSPTVPTQAASDNSTKAASTAYVTTGITNAIAGVNPAVAVSAATTAASDTSGFTYNNGASGIGAFFTGTVNVAVTIDGFTFTTLGQRLLVKNDTQSPSGAFNGVYYVTQVQTGILAPILTRALDYDAPSDINSTGAIPVVNGTVNIDTSWLLTSTVTTVGTDPLTYVQFSVNPTTILTAAANLTTGDLVKAAGNDRTTVDAGFLATNVVRKDTTNTAATGMTLDMSGATGATALKIPVIAGATSGADGTIDYDSTAKITHVRTNGADSSVITETATSTTTTQVLHATAVAGIGTFSAIATGDLPGSGATTANGQTCTLGSTCNVNVGATAHSVAINQGNGAALTGVGAGTTGQFLRAATTADPTYSDFPEVHMIPAANCNNTTAGAGWSIPSGGTVSCRAGTNNLGGAIVITDTSSTFAQFAIAIPEDDDVTVSALIPYIRFQIASSNSVNSATIIPAIKVSCEKGDGSTTDDVAFNASHSLSTITENTTANQFWSTSNVQMNSTDMTGCAAGSLMIVQVGRATDTDVATVRFYSATITFPRRLVVQAN